VSSAATRRRTLFRQSRWDALPALSGLGIAVLLVATFLGFHQLPWWFLAPAWLAITWSYWWNLQCISHNFIHNAFFSHPWLNRAYSVLLTIDLGVPQICYHHYHMNHHFGDNDRRGPDGTTKDWSSIYRYGSNDEPEGFWKYIFVSFFRAEVGPVVERVMRHGVDEVMQLLVEVGVLAAFWTTMLLLDWQFFVFFYLSSYYLGWVLSYAEGYLEHYGCKPGNQYANSVSSYNRTYNLMSFNNGYHQEHHWDPKCHWTRMTDLHERIEPQLKANGTRVLIGPHITGLIEDWLRRREVVDAPTEQTKRAA
jgi:fatty acid desaturase